MKNTFRGRCTWFFFHFITEKSPSPNSFYEVRSLHFTLPYFTPLHSAKHLIYWNVVWHISFGFYKDLHFSSSILWKIIEIMEIIRNFKKEGGKSAFSKQFLLKKETKRERKLVKTQVVLYYYFMLWIMIM